MSTKVLLPARVVYQLDREIEDLEKLIARKRERLSELRAMRASVDKEPPRREDTK